MRMLTYLAVIEILNAKVVENLKDIRKIDQGKIQSVITLRHPVLHRQVHSKNKEWLYQYIDKHE